MKRVWIWQSHSNNRNITVNSKNLYSAVSTRRAPFWCWLCFRRLPSTIAHLTVPPVTATTTNSMRQANVFLKKLTVLWLVNSHWMELEDSLPCSLKPASYPYREPEKFSPRPPIQFLEQSLFKIYHKPIKTSRLPATQQCWSQSSEIPKKNYLSFTIKNKVQNWYEVKFHHTRSTIKRLLKRSRFNVRYTVY
jgi:hypothetical protein